MTENYSLSCRFITTLLLVWIICLSLLTTDGLVAANEENGVGVSDYFDDPYYHYENERRSSQILSRKRRYLTFPSGSSFQLVYDLIVGVVDYTNYLILGVTSALAWQLPSEAPSELVEKVQDKLKDGTLGTQRNDTIENIQYINTKAKTPAQNYPQKTAYITSFTNPSQSSYYSSSTFHPPMHSKYYSSDPIPSSYGFSNKVDTNYYSIRQNPLTEWKDNQLRKAPPPTKSTSTYSTLVSKWSQWWNKSKPKFAKPGGYKRRHRIYPVFAKRSVHPHHREKRHGIVGTSLSKLDQIHLRYHRNSRQDLYLKVEKYLETHNKDGHQCVLKALCQTGQKSNEVEPGTFVGEIMRSIFTMPESDGSVHNYMQTIYDEAHAHEGSCVEKYPLCNDSLWKADFVL